MDTSAWPFSRRDTRCHVPPGMFALTEADEPPWMGASGRVVPLVAPHEARANIQTVPTRASAVFVLMASPSSLPSPATGERDDSRHVDTGRASPPLRRAARAFPKDLQDGMG